jgi:hypothetical protein
VSKQQGQQTSVKEFTRVKKMIEATYKTPNDLKIPCLNIEAATLELVILPTDLVAATEVVASALDRGVVRNITIIGDVGERNGQVSVFFRRKCNVREKAILHALEKEDRYISVAAHKLGKLLNSGLLKEALVKLELVGLQHLTSEALASLAQGLAQNASLNTLCLNDSNVGDKGLLELIPSLRDHKGLRRLQLCRAQISDVAGRALMEMLHVQVLWEMPQKLHRDASRS